MVTATLQWPTSPTATAADIDRSMCKESEEGSSSHYDTDDDSFYLEFGSLFDSHHPVRTETFRWPVVQLNTNSPSTTTTTSSSSSNTARAVAVSVAISDSDPPDRCTNMSGLYLWPAASVLAEYLVQHYAQQQVQSVVELGAGCGLLSLTALQLWQYSLQCVVVSDQDPNTLMRARDNLESTMQALINEAGDDDDDGLNVIINSLASIPVAFESLEWGDTGAMEGILRNQIQEHSQFAQAHMILGSDLIFDASVVKPLLQTVHALMAQTGCFLLCQSIAFTTEVEDTIASLCNDLQLSRRLLDERNGCRIEEFSHQRR